ncbi:MAG: biotin--[acetyl-CoA-carboxylase] ligase [Nocardioidaceae bacterium]
MSSRYSDLDRPPLDIGGLTRALVTPGSLWTAIEVIEEAESTNALVADRARAGADSGLVVIAESQTAGRGRLDRTWSAPPRSGLTMSMLIRPDDIEASRWSWLPLLAGLAAAAAVRRQAGVEAGLKWPNDVMVAERKLGGLLVERVETPGHPPAAVIGLGLNVSLRADELPVLTATSLALEGADTTDRSLLARAVLRNLEGLFVDWSRHGGDARHGLRTAYLQACMTIGQFVRVDISNAEPVEGRAVGIDVSGRLLVRSRGAQHVFGAGDVLHLRPAT